MNDNRKSLKFYNRMRNPVGLTYSSIPCSELDIASGSSCPFRPCALSRALWLRIGVHGESTRLFRLC